ncbi:MAG TPA: DUF2283 domain-containing protein [Streptosporangiaceae bacterium]|nr:DUF2283 domain-containing protein [Streptosporangiaceae bacterium]
MTLEYDLDVGALYISIGSASVARTVEFGGNANVDLDEAGRVVGIEVISAAHQWPLAEILDACELDPADAVALRAYFFPPTGRPETVPPVRERLPVMSAEPTPPVLVAA